MARTKRARRPKMFSEGELDAIEWGAIPEGMPVYDAADRKGCSYREAIESDLSRPESARAFERSGREKPAAVFTDMEEMRAWLKNL